VEGAEGAEGEEGEEGERGGEGGDVDRNEGTRLIISINSTIPAPYLSIEKADTLGKTIREGRRGGWQVAPGIGPPDAGAV